MPMEILCPAGHRLQVMPDQVNQKVRCPTCQQVFIVPEQRTATPPPVFKENDMAGLADATNAPVKPRRTSAGLQLDAASAIRYASQALLMFGLVLVLVARGCDSLGNRDSARMLSKSKLVEDQFNDSFEARKIIKQSEIDDIG